MRRTRKSLIGIALAMGVLLAGATVAYGHFAESEIRRWNASDRRVRPRQVVTFTRKLRNQHQKCRCPQEVELVRRGVGVVDVDLTDAEGEFVFKQDPQPNRGRYFARYRGRGRFGYGQGHRCGRAISEVILIRRQRRR